MTKIEEQYSEMLDFAMNNSEPTDNSDMIAFALANSEEICG